MKEFFTPFKVGVVVLLAIGAFVWMFGQVKEGIGEDPAGYRVYAMFKDVSGLVPKSRVVIAGIMVGQIDKIELVGDQGRIWLLVNTPLKSDATIAKRSASLLGDNYLALTPGTLGTPLKDGDEIKIVVTDVAPADLINEMKVIAENVRDVTGTLKVVLGGDQGERTLAGILENVERTVAEVNRTVAANGPKVDVVVDNVVRVSARAERFSENFARDAQVVMQDVRAITSEVRAIVGRSGAETDQGFKGIRGAITRLESSMEKLDGALEKTRSAAGRIDSIAGKIDDGQGTIGKLVNDPKLINSVNELVDESSRFVKQITRLQTIVSLRSEYYLGEAAAKNYFSLQLQPKPDKYYLFQLIDDPRGRTSLRETVTQSSRSDRDPVVRETQTITEDRFRFSLQYAKRFYFVTGRIGIFENTGGVGVDLHLIDDELELSTDLFSFDDNVYPRMKVWALYSFFSHLYIAAGMDDVLNTDTSDFFVGAGIRFNDEDLKALLTTAPVPSF